MTSPLRVTTVCTGNICRSPIAEVVLRAALEREGLGERVVVDSAGLGAWHVGQPPDPRSLDVLEQHGYDGSALRGAQITRAWFDEPDAPDLLLALDTGHYDELRRMAPGSEVRLLRSFDPALAHLTPGEPELDVPDPYYSPPSEYVGVLDMVEAATPGVVAHIRTLLAAG